MWVTKSLFELIVGDNKAQQLELNKLQAECVVSVRISEELKHQKGKDDLTIDWMRHRINALEKERAILLNKVAGVIVPVPEIVPTRPGTISQLPGDYDFSPSFEDVGDDKAHKLGLGHDDTGHLTFDQHKGE